MPRIALIIIPPHHHMLGISYVNAALRAHGNEVLNFDFEWVLEQTSPQLLAALRRVFSVHNPVDIDRIQFMLRPEVLCERITGKSSMESAQSLGLEESRLVRAYSIILSEFARAVRSYEPDVVLISTSIVNVALVGLFCSSLKSIAKKIPIAVGGHGVSNEVVADLFLLSGIADAVVVGEADNTVLQVVSCLAEGIEPPLIPGVRRRDGTGLTDFTEVKEPENLEELALPSLEGFPYPGREISAYWPPGSGRANNALPLATTRGCPRACTFCWESSGTTFRTRSCANVTMEVLTQQRKYHNNRFFLCDATFNWSLDYVKELCKNLLEQTQGVRFAFAHFRADPMPDRELLSLMRRLGFDMLSIGLESTSQQIVDSMAKGFSLNAAEEAIRQYLAHGISVTVNLISDFFGEQEIFSQSLTRLANLVAALSKTAHKSGANLRFVVSRTRIDPCSRLGRDMIDENAFNVRGGGSHEERVQKIIRDLLTSYRSDGENHFERYLAMKSIINRTIGDPAKESAR